MTEPGVAKLAGTHRKRAIAALARTNPQLHGQYLAAKRFNEGVRSLLASTGVFPLCGKGKINTYAVFAEMMRNTLSPTGRVGMIVPTGIASDYTTKDFFADLVQKRSIVSLYDFENRKKLFPIDSRYRFCLLTLAGVGWPVEIARFVSFAHDVADIDDPDKRYTLTPGDLALFNPNTKTMPIFRNRRDAEITTGIYRRTPVLVREGDPDGNPWDVSFKQGYYNMTSDFSLFRTRRHLEDHGWALQGNHFVRGDDRYLPLYVLAMVHQYDHRWATFENGSFRDCTQAEKQDPTFLAQPEYWVPMRETDQRIGDDRSYLLGWRDVARSTDTRTVIFSLHPRAGAGNPLPQFVSSLELRSSASVVATMNSFASDYAARQKLGGTHLNFFYLKQLAVLPPNRLRPHEAFIEPRVLELCYTAWDMFDFATELGWRGPPFRWDLQRRALIRAEIDALMFRLYGISRPEMGYMMETFEALQNGDRRRCGDYRTKRLVLKRYDAMHKAECTGKPYRTVLDPPPADSSVAHDWATQPAWHPIVQPKPEIAKK